jgi:ATP-binding cassette, subfamily B, bacterial PglK
MLDDAGRHRVRITLFWIVLMAFVETLGVASIMPFIAVLSNPDVVVSNRHLAGTYHLLGFESTNQFLVFLGVATFLLLLGSTALRAITLWAQLRFTNFQNHALSCRLVEGYLAQPYHWFLDKNSSGIAANVLSEVSNVINGAYFPAMMFIANAFIATFLIALLLIVDPVLSLLAAALVTAAYLTVYAAMRGPLNRIGEERLKANQLRYRVVSEAFGGIKEVKIAGLEKAYTEKFRDPSLRMAMRSVWSSMISELPSFVMQMLVFGGMLLVLIYLVASRDGIQGALPYVAVYAFATYRLMPALQGMYRNFTMVRVVGPATESLRRDLCELDESRKQRSSPPSLAGPHGMTLTRGITLENVAYMYPGAETSALSRINLKIEAFTTVGVVGSSGAGKTTVVDLILGLLWPFNGRLIVDEQTITTENVRAWQSIVGYVPQSIFLIDASIAENIAFGKRVDEIDQEAVVRAAKIANLHGFIMSDLPDGYGTAVGERGVRLSGGQRQRIGIARAIYHDPELLIFDEATNALDGVTEQAVMDSVYQLSRKKTILIIAHRLSTVRACDQIVLFDKGHIIAVGCYDEVFARSEQFRLMAQGSS